MARSLPLLSLALLALAACGGKVSGPDAGTDAGHFPPFPPADAGTDAGQLDATGYDTRPPNATCVAPARPPAFSQAATAPAFPNLGFTAPVLVMHAPGDASRVFVVEQTGLIKVFPNDPGATAVATFADFTSRITCCGERGLLGLAFHPDFAQTGEVFVSYTHTPAGSLRSRLVRVRSTDGGQTLDLSTEEEVLSFPQPFTNHNGGHIVFGPDGYLYFGMGDGGSGGDPQNNAQNLSSLLGKFLRLDVSQKPYAIPPDNPFAGGGGAPEIYAWGLRNPWRFAFDPETGDLWTGDVGQGALEEVDLIQRGGNYGWRLKEGTQCFNPPTNCPTAGLIDPIVEYPRTQGISITGGHVYRGTAIPSLVGRYVYGDFGSGRIWAVRTDPASGAHTGQELLDSPFAISSFGEAPDGELYVIHYSTANLGGRIHRLVPSGTPPPDTFPATLTATGCVDPQDPRKPAPGVIPFDITSPLWSDGAEKERFLAIPDGAQIALAADGDFDFPPGTVLMKTFLLADAPVETRLFIRHLDGDWGGYSYEWNEAGTDALLLPAGKTKTIAGQSWAFPSRGQCMTCHTAAAGRALGPELAQLARPVRYPTGRLAPQLDTLAHIGLFAGPLPDPLPALADPPDARAYLHANCSGCHRPGGTTQAEFDVRWQTPFAETKTCEVDPRQGTLGVADAKLVKPGLPAQSLVPLRMRALDAHRMPPLASSAVDAAGVAQVEAWIAELQDCP